MRTRLNAFLSHVKSTKLVFGANFKVSETERKAFYFHHFSIFLIIKMAKHICSRNSYTTHELLFRLARFPPRIVFMILYACTSDRIWQQFPQTPLSSYLSLTNTLLTQCRYLFSHVLSIHVRLHIFLNSFVTLKTMSPFSSASNSSTVRIHIYILWS